MKIKNSTSNYLLEDDHLVDLLSGAFYYSSWFRGEIPDQFYKEFDTDDAEVSTLEEALALILKRGDFIRVIDLEDDKDYQVTLDMIQNAWNSDTKEIIRAKYHILYDCADFYDYDAIVQTAIFGEVVYG